MARSVPQRFLVAFSLAGEQRGLIRAVAKEVERQLGESTVFFDEWFEFYIAGADADLKLQRIYREQCELAVICISGDYGSKPWTRAEYEAVRSRYMSAAGSTPDHDRVLAVRVGDGEVEGIHLNYIVPDLRKRTVNDAAQLIIDRLRLVSPFDVVSIPEKFSWPERLPVFRWPIADHVEAQTAFCALLMRTSEAKVLPILGASESGKSSLAKQMEKNVAESMPELRCGRFDFKGVIDRTVEVDGLARSLGVDLPAGIGRLSDVLSQLLHLAEPALLILDTYEDAGDAAGWMERVFFPQLLRTELLRVVVLGQRIPRASGEVWESIRADIVKLALPDAEAWLEYGRRQRPDADIDLDFVARAHRLVQGRPSTLAGLLGPA